MISKVTLKYDIAGLKAGKKYEVVEIKASGAGASVIIRENGSTTVHMEDNHFYEREDILKEVRGW